MMLSNRMHGLSRDLIPLKAREAAFRDLCRQVPQM